MYAHYSYVLPAHGQNMTAVPEIKPLPSLASLNHLNDIFKMDLTCGWDLLRATSSPMNTNQKSMTQSGDRQCIICSRCRWTHSTEGQTPAPSSLHFSAQTHGRAHNHTRTDAHMTAHASSRADLAVL